MGLTVLGSDMAKKITVLDAIHMAVEAWGKVKQSTIQNCFKKCLQDQSVQVDPIEVPEGYSREAWESQIDLEDFTEQEIEDEIQVLVETMYGC